MADASINLKSVDLFGLGSNFEPQQTVDGNVSLLQRAFSESGLSVASARLSADIQYATSYRYCGTALATDLGTVATAFGGIYDATALGYGNISITSIEIAYSAMAYPLITMRGHNHTAIAHTTAVNTKSIVSAIPASGFGVPNFGVTTGTDSSPVAAALSIVKGHADVLDADGTHIHGANTQETKLLLNMSFVGVPTSSTEAALETDLAAITGFDIVIPATSTFQNNSQFTTFAFSAEGFGTT